jgi:hypothetical protein
LFLSGRALAAEERKRDAASLPIQKTLTKLNGASVETIDELITALPIQ